MGEFPLVTVGTRIDQTISFLFFLQYGYRTRIQNKTYYERLVCILATRSMHSNNYICIYTSQYINSRITRAARRCRPVEKPNHPERKFWPR